MSAKIFGIGLFRTGTRSLHAALEILGFRSSHTPQRQRFVVRRNKREGRRLLQGMDGRFDAFSDQPIMFEYPRLDLDYPGSKFIWTRRDTEPWLRSLANMTKLRIMHPIYEEDFYKIEPARWRRLYHQHETGVRRYFAGKGNFLELDICGGTSWEPLCDFLQLPVPEDPFPKLSDKNWDEYGR